MSFPFTLNPARLPSAIFAPATSDGRNFASPCTLTSVVRAFGPVTLPLT